jgi:transcriptional regulator with XRE-family HTH domain
LHKSLNKEFLALVQNAGWSQAEAARRLHLTAGAVSQICRRRTRPRAATVALLRRLVEEQRIMSHAGVGRVAVCTLDPAERRLLRKFRKLGLKERRIISGIIEQMFRD